MLTFKNGIELSRLQCQYFIQSITFIIKSASKRVLCSSKVRDQSSQVFIINLQMQQSDEEEKIQSNQEVLNRLNALNEQMEGLIAIPEQLLRSYVGLYVQRHSLSDDFFTALCEHAIVQKLFGVTARHLPAVVLLQIFHLLLANTTQQNSLVFIFSQACVHEFLFERFGVFSESVDAVEYYVQLLKTIVLKISTHGNNSLIKLFCNSRYPSFPLLSAVVTLATADLKEQLVRVTARQCFLQLAALINEKQVGRGYLTDLQMAVFLHEFTSGMQEGDEEGQLKYLADLLFALRDNPTSLSLLLSAFTNNVLLSLLNNFPALLRMLRKLDGHVEEHGSFPSHTHRAIKRVFLNIVTTFFFSKFTNSTYMTALKVLSPSKTPQPNIAKLYQKRGQKIGAFLLEFDSKKETEDEKLLLYEGWVNFNCSSEEVQKIKEGKHKSKGGFFSNFFSKPDPQEEYVKKALTAVGLNYDEFRFPLYKLTVSLNMKTGIYIVEQALVRRQERGEVINREKMQAHINDFKGKFELCQEMCLQVLHMLSKVKAHNLSMALEATKCPPEVEFQYGFLLKLRSYLLNTLSDYILVSEKELPLRNIAAISQMITQLGLPLLLDRKARQKMVWKLEQVQQEIHDLTFANDFKKLIGYVVYNKQEEFLKLFDHNNQPTSPSPKSLVELKTFKYQFIRRIIDPKLESISQFVNRQWCQALTHQEASFLTFIVPYKDTGSIEVKPSNQGIVLVLTKGEGQVQSIRVGEDDPRVDLKDMQSLSFKELAEKIKLRDKEQALQMRNNIERIRSFREEQMTKLIVQYFETTYNQIRDKILQRIK